VCAGACERVSGGGKGFEDFWGHVEFIVRALGALSPILYIGDEEKKFGGGVDFPLTLKGGSPIYGA
jgi:hypothetical protein